MIEDKRYKPDTPPGLDRFEIHPRDNGFMVRNGEDKQVDKWGLLIATMQFIKRHNAQHTNNRNISR